MTVPPARLNPVTVTTPVRATVVRLCAVTTGVSGSTVTDTDLVTVSKFAESVGVNSTAKLAVPTAGIVSASTKLYLPGVLDVPPDRMLSPSFAPTTIFEVSGRTETVGVALAIDTGTWIVTVT